MMRFVVVGLALLAMPARAQSADVLDAAQSVREALLEDRYLAEATAAYQWCGLRPPEWGEVVFQRIVEHGKREVEFRRNHTSDPQAYWALASQLWDEHWVRISRVASRSQFSASECLDARSNSRLSGALDNLYRGNR